MEFGATRYVWLLALAPLALALFAYAAERRRRALAAFVDRASATRLLPRVDARRRWLKAGCLGTGIALLVVALMQPQWGTAEHDVPRRGRDVVVVLDVSLSMLAEDVAPNRLEAAKRAIAALSHEVQEDGGHRLALVTFAGRASLQVPLTSDYALFRERLEEVGVGSVVRKGTLLGQALRQSVQGFGELAPGYTDLILLTDGDDHDSLPLEAARAAAARGIRLYAVGLGDAAVGAPIPLAQVTGDPGHLHYQGEEVRSRQRPDVLTQVADAAGGIYVNGSERGLDLVGLYGEHIAGAPQRELETTTSAAQAHRYQWFVLLALFLLGLELLMPDRRR